MKKSRIIALTSVFAALNIVCDAIAGLPQLSSGVWYGWIFIMEPLNGIILGPLTGFVSTFLGVFVGHSIYVRGEAPIFEYIFTLGAPLGAMVSGLVYRKKWKIVLTYYIILLAAYFLTPVTWYLPIWGIWNVLFAFFTVCIIFLLKSKFDKLQAKSYILSIAAFVGLEADILFRIFILVPCQTYRLFYGFSIETLQAIWTSAAFITPIQVLISLIVTTIISPRLLQITQNLNVHAL